MKTTAEVRCDEADGFLPRPSPFKPIHYDLELKPDVYRADPPFPFSGRVWIYVRCEQSDMSTMTLNSWSYDEFHILNLSITVYSGSAHAPAISDVSPP